MLTTFKLEKMRLRIIPLLLLYIASLLFLYSLFYLFIIFFRNSAANSVFLHVSLAFWILFISSIFVVLTTILWKRSSKWIKLEPLFLILILCLFFWSQGNHAYTLFTHPVYLALYTFSFLLVQLLIIIDQNKNILRTITYLAFFIPFFALLFFFVLRIFNTLSVSNNGGLIQPTLFRFDFSPYLSLQNEIKLNDNLVLIVHTAHENTNTFLRRTYLSGWNPNKGFYEQKAPDESNQITEVPNEATEIQHLAYKMRTTADQEYFIVNFDPSSLISMDYPIKIIPYKIWNTTAFNRAYSVTSKITGFIPFELYDSKNPSGKEEEGMSAKSLSFYTSIDADTNHIVEGIAKTLTYNIPGYYDKIQALTSYLHDGQFRYSLKPGRAPDGNQLRYFLQDTKKGYCTYFAFSLCLMLRSIGVPSRIAAGFFIQPDSGSLDYYPVRANMAHAWVEVFFPYYGWIAFDPTTTTLAEGEDIQISTNPGGDEFLKLLNEIIENRNLIIQNPLSSPRITQNYSISHWLNKVIFGIKQTYGLIIIVFSFIVFLYVFLYRYLVISFSQNQRKVILFCASEMYQFYRRKGKKFPAGQSRFSFVSSLNDKNAFLLFSLEQKARYSPYCTNLDAQLARQLIKLIKVKKIHSHFLILFFACTATLFFSLPINAQQKEYADLNDKKTIKTAEDTLLTQAKEAISAENWESAIKLLNGGMQLYPTNPLFHFTLGTLYSEKSLYTPAIKEFLTALSLGFTNPEVFSQLADCSGYLNKDEEAFLYLKHYLRLVPDDLIAWSNFGWLCYKTNRLDEGIETLRRIIQVYGPDGNLYVGLGNLYTAAYNYNEAHKYYTLAIDMAKKQNQPFLSSIDYYNRSILEETFYHFEKAYEDTTLSVEATPRSSGYLMQGELELRRLQFMPAFSQYLKAFNLDSTPLASMGLAETLLQAGYPDQSAVYMNNIKKRTDLSWIANYGTTTDQFDADLHKTLKDLYLFRLNVEKRKTVHNLYTFVQNCCNIVTNSMLYWYNDAIYRIKTKKVAQDYENSEKKYHKNTEHGLQVFSFYFLAFNKWHRVASPYLDKAMLLETNFIPAAKPSYLYEQAHLKNNISLFDEAIKKLDPEWERQYIAKALSERIIISPNSDEQIKMDYIHNLYAIQPAAFIFYNINLPVFFSFSGSNTTLIKKENRHICKYLQNAGFVENKKAPFILDISNSKDLLSLMLIDKSSNHTIYAQVLHKNKTYAQDLSMYINSFSTSVFRTDIGIK